MPTAAERKRSQRERERERGLVYVSVRVPETGAGMVKEFASGIEEGSKRKVLALLFRVLFSKR